MPAARILGHVDELGYLYCAACHPEALDDPYPVRSDQSAHVDEPCESCHRPLNQGEKHA